MVVETCRKIPIAIPRMYSWWVLKIEKFDVQKLPRGAIMAKVNNTIKVVRFLLPASIKNSVSIKATGIL